MNVICNTCLGARLYQLSKIQYSNPFMWNIIEADSMINLISKFNSINFSNITVLESDYISRSKPWRKQYVEKNEPLPVIYKIVIDDIIEVHYLHYKLDVNYSSPTIQDIDVYYNKIWEYIFNRYIERIKRMINAHELPTFVISTAEESYSVEKQNQLIDVINNSPYKMCIITSDLAENIINNAIIINADIKSMNNTMLQARTFRQIIMSHQS